MSKFNGLQFALISIVAVVAARPGIADSGHSGGHGGGGHVGGAVSGGGSITMELGAVGTPPYYGMGWVPFGGPFLPFGAPGLVPVGPAMFRPRGPVIAAPPPAMGGAEQGGAARKRPREARPADPDRSRRLVTFGDRLFRANNSKKAEERFEQALRSDPQAAAPRVRLAQVAFVRGRYTEAADWLREAETAQPGWLATPFDIQSIYGEPDDFNRRVAQLESHLHAHPDDQDAWLVLGAQWYLTGRTARAADIFLRLDDPRRRPDVALAAFLAATEARD
jgi:hypothetical protein